MGRQIDAYTHTYTDIRKHHVVYVTKICKGIKKTTTTTTTTTTTVTICALL